MSTYDEIDWDAPDTSQEAIAAAADVGGAPDAADRVADLARMWSVVSDKSADTKYEEVIPDLQRPGKTRVIEATRAGWFRFGSASNPERHLQTLAPLVMVHVAEGRTLFRENAPVCKAYSISPNGFRNLRAVEGSLQPTGTDCRTCPFNQREPFDLEGNPIAKQDACKGNINVFWWNPEEDPEAQDVLPVNFTAMSIGIFKDYLATRFEKAKAKYWLVLGAMRSKFGSNENGSYYAPDHRALRALTADEAAISEDARQRLMANILVQCGQSDRAALQAPRERSLSAGELPALPAETSAPREVPWWQPLKEEFINLYCELKLTPGLQSQLAFLSEHCGHDVQGYAHVAEEGWQSAIADLYAKKDAADAQGAFDDPFMDRDDAPPVGQLPLGNTSRKPAARTGHISGFGKA